MRLTPFYGLPRLETVRSFHTPMFGVGAHLPTAHPGSGAISPTARCCLCEMVLAGFQLPVGFLVVHGWSVSAWLR